MGGKEKGQNRKGRGAFGKEGLMIFSFFLSGVGGSTSH
jgi:hypothetical protein